MKLNFYHCNICGKVITVLTGDGIPTDCCGETMTEIVPNRTDAAAEKHVPVFHTEAGIVFVRVGSEPHPMTEAHSILWIGLRTTHGYQYKQLGAGQLPEACFALLSGERAEAVYAYCDCHGLWCSEEESAPAGRVNCHEN